jgi:hypothetical protein
MIFTSDSRLFCSKSWNSLNPPIDRWILDNRMNPRICESWWEYIIHPYDEAYKAFIEKIPEYTGTHGSIFCM